MNGETCFESKAANLIIAEMIHETDNHGQKIKLTKREAAVLNYAAKGNSIKMTADKLGLSPRTIETHRNNMFKKTGSANITELIAWGRKNGYLED
jgi:DNA-binding NarL/FixJ family response regulator